MDEFVVDSSLSGVLILLAIPMLINCFFGYKIQKILVTIGGIFIGGFLGFLGGSIATYDDADMTPAIIVILIILFATLGGLIAFKLYRFGIFMHYWLLGTLFFAVPLFIMSKGDPTVFAVAAVLGLLIGILALVLHKGFIIVTTAVSGGMTAGISIGFAARSVAFGVVLGVILSAVGIFVQYYLERKHPKRAYAPAVPGQAAPPAYGTYAPGNYGTPAAAPVAAPVRMPEQYAVISTVSPKAQCVKSGVLVHSVSLLKGQYSGTYLKAEFGNLSDTCLIAVYFKVVGYGVAGENLGEQVYSLIDLHINPNQKFSSGMIRLFNDQIRMADVTITQTVDINGSVAKFYEHDIIAMPKLTEIRERLSPELVELAGILPDERYISQDYGENMWICTCGHVGRYKCPNCGRTANQSMRYLSKEVITDRIHNRISSISGGISKCRTLNELNACKHKISRISSLLAGVNIDDKLSEECRAALLAIASKSDKIKKHIRLRNKRLKRWSLLAAAALVVVLIIVGTVKAIIGMPPGNGRIKSDAEDCIEEMFGNDYTIKSIDFSKYKGSQYYFATVNAKAKNNENGDILQFEMRIDYSKSDGRYKVFSWDMFSHSVHPDHKITEADNFSIPNMILDFDGNSLYVDSELRQNLIDSGDLSVEFDIDYDKAVVSEEDSTAVVPGRFKLKYLTSAVDTEAELHYTYEENYQWSCTESVTFHMSATGNMLSQQLMRDLIDGTEIEYMNEKLSGKYLTLDSVDAEYNDGFDNATLTANFIWDNGSVKFDGLLTVGFKFTSGQWNITGSEIVFCSDPVRYKEFSEENLKQLISQIIQEHCSEKANVSDIKITDTDEISDGLLVTAEYTSKNEGFILNNIITARLKSGNITGYYFNALQSEEIQSAKIPEKIHKSFKVSYQLSGEDTKPVGVPSSGTSTLTLDVDTDCSAELKGTFGSIQLDMTGKLVYPGRNLSMSDDGQDIDVNYDLLVSGLNAELNFVAESSLVYADTLTGSIQFDTRAAGVDGFAINIK